MGAPLAHGYAFGVPFRTHLTRGPCCILTRGPQILSAALSAVVKYGVFSISVALQFLMKRKTQAVTQSNLLFELKSFRSISVDNPSFFFTVVTFKTGLNSLSSISSPFVRCGCSGHSSEINHGGPFHQRSLSLSCTGDLPLVPRSVGF